LVLHLVFFSCQQPHPNTVIGVWKNWEGFYYTDELVKVTAAGYKVVLSACWYLNYFSYGEHWFQVSSVFYVRGKVGTVR